MLAITDRLWDDAGRYYADPQAGGNLLHDFLGTTRPWSQERVSLPRRLTAVLWVLISLQLVWDAVLVTLVRGDMPCRGPICTIGTLNHHAAALLACGVFCVIGLVGLIPTTHGLSKGNGIEVSGLTLASAAGGVSLLGIATLVIAAVIILALFAIFFLAFAATS